MNFYQPELPDGTLAPLALPFYGYKFNFLWPLKKHATSSRHMVRNVAMTVSMLCYIGTMLAEMFFIIDNLYDIPLLAEALSAIFMCIQYFVRLTLLFFKQQRMRELVEDFYKRIYFMGNVNKNFYGRIHRIMRFLAILTTSYWFPMVSKIFRSSLHVIRNGMSSRTKPFVFRMATPWFDDEQAPIPYLITSFHSFWQMISCLFLMSADDYFLCLVLVHTTYRYKELQKELEEMLNELQEEARLVGVGVESVHSKFHKRLHQVFQKQQQLDSFVEIAKQHFSPHIFCCISFGVVMLCIICFRQQTSVIDSKWIHYCTFLVSQTLEFLLIGYFGQMLLDETGAMHDSYYMCHWELLLPNSRVDSNISLIKDIKFAILRTERATALHGMHMFPLNHATVLSALRKAASYFMFLRTISDVSK